MSQALLVIYKSPNGRGNWVPLKRHEVPEFVLREDVMGRLVNGEMCCDVAVGDSGSDWYKAVRVVSERELAAQKRREMRQAKRLH